LNGESFTTIEDPMKISFPPICLAIGALLFLALPACKHRAADHRTATVSAPAKEKTSKAKGTKKSKKAGKKNHAGTPTPDPKPPQ
jgi:hypothetical protein